MSKSNKSNVDEYGNELWTEEPFHPAREFAGMGKHIARSSKAAFPDFLKIAAFLVVTVVVLLLAWGVTANLWKVASDIKTGGIHFGGSGSGDSSNGNGQIVALADQMPPTPTATPIPAPIATAQVAATVSGIQGQITATYQAIAATQSALNADVQSRQFDLAKQQNEYVQSQRPSFWTYFIPAVLVLATLAAFGWVVATALSRYKLAQAQGNTVVTDHLGNYTARWYRGQIVTAAPGNALPANVPTSLHYAPSQSYAPHIINKTSDAPPAALAAPFLDPMIVEAEAVKEVEPLTAQSALALLPRNQLAWCFGRDLETGEPIIQTLPDSMHTLTVGSSGMGKTTLNANLLYQLVGANDAKEYNFVVCDLKGSLADPVKQFAFATANEPGDYVHIMEMMRQTLEDRRARKDFHGTPWLVVLEEALAVRNYMTAKDMESYSKNLEVLSLLAREYRIYILASQQVDYSSNDFKNSRGQFLTRVAGAVPPRAAGSMGFFNTPLVNQNWKARQPGQFLIESPGGDRLIRAPKLDVKGGEFGFLMASLQPAAEAKSMPDGSLMVAKNNQASTPLQSAESIISAEDMRIVQAFKAGKSVADICKDIYGVSSSAGRAYQSKSSDIQEALRRGLAGAGV